MTNEKSIKTGRGASSLEVADGAVTQSERFVAKARELGLDEREEAFDAALAKVARHKPTATKTKTS